MVIFQYLAKTFTCSIMSGSAVIMKSSTELFIIGSLTWWVRNESSSESIRLWLSNMVQGHPINIWVVEIPIRTCLSPVLLLNISLDHYPPFQTILCWVTCSILLLTPLHYHLTSSSTILAQVIFILAPIQLL